MNVDIRNVHTILFTTASFVKSSAEVTVQTCGILKLRNALVKARISCPRHGISVHRVLSCYDHCSCSVHVDCVTPRWNICSYEYNGARVANAGNGVRKLVNRYNPAKRNKNIPFLQFCCFTCILLVKQHLTFHLFRFKTTSYVTLIPHQYFNEINKISTTKTKQKVLNDVITSTCTKCNLLAHRIMGNNRENPTT